MRWTCGSLTLLSLATATAAATPNVPPLQNLDDHPLVSNNKNKPWFSLPDSRKHGVAFQPAGLRKGLSPEQKLRVLRAQQRILGADYYDEEDADAYYDEDADAANDAYYDEGEEENNEEAYDEEEAAQEEDGENYSSSSYAWTQETLMGTTPFAVDATQTYWDDFAQAWRLLGFYVDCSSAGMASAAEYYAENGNENQQQSHHSNEEEWQIGCVRTLLWAAYVDPNYSGNGLAEYAMYNPHDGAYNYDGCTSDRCVEMNCHEEDNTSFELLGIFKEPGYDDWFEQLFKHEGMCVWTQEEYDFMQTYRESWPLGCTLASTGYYIAMKPLANAKMAIGAYTDDLCSKEVRGSYNVDKLSGYQYSSLISYMDSWNEYLSIYNICQPCKAYTPAWMQYYGSASAYYYNENYGYWDQMQEYGYSYYQQGSHEDKGKYENVDDYDNFDESNDPFGCPDDAGYYSVNQCMKFYTHTSMLQAFDFDVVMAYNQGTTTLLPYPISSATMYQGGVDDDDEGPPAFFWIISMYGVIATAFVVNHVVQQRKRGASASSASLSTPLMD